MFQPLRQSISLAKLGTICAFLAVAAVCPGLADSTISLPEREAYQVSFHFVVTNKQASPLSGIEVSIPIPEDDQGQKISNLSWNLSHYEWSDTKDEFGQNLRQIKLGTLQAKEHTDVGYTCNVEIQPVRVVLDKNNCGSLSEIPAEIRTKYTNDLAEVYDYNSPTVREVADKIRLDNPNLLDRLHAIHDYVSERISYNLSGQWLSAPEVINRKTGSCSEYTFVFAALCRANGLPTRTVGSSHLRTRTNFPYKDTDWHRWLEVYLPPYGWVPFDSTLDRGKPAKQNCFGSYDFRTLRVSRGGVESRILGQSYVGCTNSRKGIDRDRYFVWVPLAQADKYKSQPQFENSGQRQTDTGAKP